MPLTRRLPAHRVFTSTRAQVQSLTLHLPSPPPLNGYYRTFRGRMLLSKRGRQFKLAVYAAWLKSFGHSRIAFPEGLVTVTLQWCRPRKIGDTDSIIKATLDALNGLAYTDDKQVSALLVFRSDGPIPGVQVIVSRATPPREDQ